MKLGWAGLLLAALACGASANVAPPTRADLVIVDKGRRELVVYAGATALARYRVALGAAPRGHKRCQGDMRTPEGEYTISGRNPNSAFHRSLRISYPSPVDRAAAARAGCTPGGDIMIHGLKNGFGWLGEAHHRRDWTHGCIAVTDREIEQLWQLVPDGTRIVIRP